MDNQINHKTQEELIRLREQLTALRGHLNSTAAVTARQEAIVNQIRTQLQTFDPNPADYPQTRNWYQQHDSLAMEKDKLDDIAKRQNETSNQASMIEERVNQLVTQAKQQETAIQASQSENDDLELDLYAALDDAENTNTNTDAEPTTQGVLLFQLSQSQQQINALTEERDALKAKNLLSFKRCAILSREKQLIEKQSLTLRTQRNVLQSRLDALEDQGMDIGEPRNDAEAEARVSRRRQRERSVYDGLAGAKIFPAQEEAYDGVVLETELLDATDQIVGMGPPLLSPKEKHAIDMLFEEASDDTNENGIEQEINAPVPQQFVFDGYIDNDMVYENNEDLIDWTQDDEEYKFTSYPPVSLKATSSPFPPLHTGEREVPEGWNNNGGDFVDLHQEELYKIQRDAALAELEKPWEDLSRPLSPRSIPHYLPPGSPSCEEKLAQLQAEFDALNKELYQTRGELESLRRDSATKSAAGKGARLRIKVLEEGILEREVNEQQLREELRLEREEDPLADNLFVELNGVRGKLEACEEEKADVQGKLGEVQDQYEGYKVEIEAKIQELKRQLAGAENAEKEATARVTALEEAAEKGNAWVGELEQKIVVGNGQLDSLTDTIWAREEEIKLLNAELGTLKDKLQFGQDNSEVLQNLTEALAAKEQRLQAEHQTQTQALERARSELQGCDSNAQKLRTGLKNADAEVKKLMAQLNEAIEERDQARNEARNAVAAAEKGRDEVGMTHRELEASNEMGHRLRSISSENTRELASVREERDTAVHSIGRLERDLNSCREDIAAVKAQLIEISNERDDLVKENQNVVGRYMDAERRAEEHWKRVMEGMAEIERLRLAVNEPDSPLAHILTPKTTPKPTKPMSKRKSTSKPKHKPTASTSSVQSIRPPRISRNPNPIYTVPLSPGSPTPPPTTLTALKPDRKRKRGASEADVANKQQEKKRRRK